MTLYSPGSMHRIGNGAGHKHLDYVRNRNVLAWVDQRSTRRPCCEFQKRHPESDDASFNYPS